MSSKDSEKLQEAEDIYSDMQDLFDRVPERGQEFAESVMEKADSIIALSRNSGFVTEGSLQALKNMKGGLQKWVRD